MMRLRTRGAVLAAALLGCPAVCASAQAADQGANPAGGTQPAAEYRGATSLGLALRRLGPTGRVLMIGAHPDDEDTQLLARLALGEGADVAYLSLTRGEGGQNAIGPDFQEALGIIRTGELLAARRVDGARQYFGRAYDYGFSKSAEEAFQHWPQDSLLADVVHVIRLFRPDVVVSVFTGTTRDGHGQHQASGIVAKEGFAAAGDPARFPAQIRAGLAPWQPRKLYHGGYFQQDSSTTRYPTGVLDPLLGLSYAEVAAISRGRHRSQEMARPLPLGPRATGVNLVADRTGAPGPRPERSVFQGLDTTLAARTTTALGSSAAAARLLAAYDSVARAARAEFNALDPDGVVPLLGRAARLLLAADSALPNTAAGDAVRWHLREEHADAITALTAAQQLVLGATAPVEQVTPGATVEVSRTVWNGGRGPVTWHVTADSALVVAPGEAVSRPLLITVPADPRSITEPYYLRSPRRGDLYTWPPGEAAAAQPFEPPMSAAFDVVVDGAVIRTHREVTFRAVSPIDGETRRPIRVVPAVSVRLDRPVVVRPLAQSEPLALAVRVAEEAGGAVAGELRLQLPDGWSAAPAALSLRLASHEARQVRFAVTPPAALRAGSYNVAAVFRDSAGREYARGFQLIDYPHINPYPLYAAARTRIEAVDVIVPPALRTRPVGYITGPGDDVAGALEQLGIEVDRLSPESLGGDVVDLSRYATIVVGVRAYEARPELAAANPRLLEWVRSGGTLLVQYQQAGWTDGGVAPYPLTIGRPAERVTDETAPVTVLDPASPALNRPNVIGEADWRGWVQERGLYIPRSWDPNWKPLLELADPGQQPQRGALLVATYGEGTVIYTSLAFFRQLPAGVPGAYRLFVNLLAGGR